jgi:hypothetical protein
VECFRIYKGGRPAGSFTLTQTQSCGEALVRLLEDYGVEIVFGVPGVHTLELYRGLAQAGRTAVSGREIAAFGGANGPPGALRRLPDVPHRAAHRAYPAGRFAAMK